MKLPHIISPFHSIQKITLLLILISVYACSSGVNKNTNTKEPLLIIEKEQKDTVTDNQINSDTIKEKVIDTIHCPQCPEKILTYPGYSDDIIYSNCDDILKTTPKEVRFRIHCDTVIDLSAFDEKLAIKMRFLWIDYDNHLEFNYGVHSIDIIKTDALNRNSNHVTKLSTMDLLSTTGLVEIYKDEKGEAYRNDMLLKDINMDGYLDFYHRRECGKGCYYSYWIYNKEKETFVLNEQLDYFRPNYYDCSERVVFSIPVSSSSNIVDYDAFKIHNTHISFYQRLTKEFNKDENIIIHKYYNSDNDMICIDTIPYKQ